MAVKSIIDIEVNDAPFRAFSDFFKAHEQRVKDSPLLWGRMTEAVARTGETIGQTGEATNAAAKSAEAVSKAWKRNEGVVATQVASVRKMADQHEGVSHLLDGQVRAWKRLADNSRHFAVNIAGATRDLLRWGALTGLISGVAGLGGLFGIERLATGAGNARRTALGLGITPGEQRAFELDYARVADDPAAVLSGVSEALTDPTKRGTIYNLGLTERDIAGKDAAQVSIGLIDKIAALAKSTPLEYLENTRTTRHLDQLGVTAETFRRLRDTPASELAQYRTQYGQDAAAFGVSSGQVKLWQDLENMLDRAGRRLETGLERMLAPLSGPIGHLSDAFTHAVTDLMKNPNAGEFIDALAGQIDHLATYLEKEDLQKDLGIFVNKVADAWHATSDFVGGVQGVVKDIENVWHVLEAIWHGLDAFGTGIATLAHRILDPFASITGLPTEEQAQAEQHNRDYPGDQRPVPGVPAAPPSGDRPWYDRLLHPFGYGSGRAGEGPGGWSVPRGLRNRNPLNLTYAGQAGAIGSDGRFAIFPSMEAGIAASEAQLLRYQASGTDTLAKVISRWAPAVENDTPSYITEVSNKTGIDPNQRLDFHDEKTAGAIIKAMAQRESGTNGIDDAIARGVHQALAGQQGTNTAALAPQRPTSLRLDIRSTAGSALAITAGQVAYGP